ncbi:MAG: dTDP-4-dehydrorhamnose reductase [Pyrinomonadaceae bacterium]
MRVIVTGADGMLAQAVKNRCLSIGDDVVALNRGQLDISDREQVFAAITAVLPDAVINCAAFTDVDGAEANEAACYAANAVGVENLASACDASGAVFVTVSTDYVFDGTHHGFYTQRDTPNPLGVYGKAKREGEIRAFAIYPRSIIVRSGWIFGHGGTNFLSNIPRLLGEGTPIKAIADSYGTPTFADDLAIRLRELAAADLPGVYHVTNEGSGCSYFGFAEKICEIGGFDRGLLQSASYKDLQRPAPRPVSSKLACLISERLGFERMRNWEAALKDYLGLFDNTGQNRRA